MSVVSEVCVGSRLASRLNLTITGTEGHDLTGPCPAPGCGSSDAFRLDQATGRAYCHSCHAKWSPYALAESRIGADRAKALMVELGIFEDWGNGHQGSGNGRSQSTDPIGDVAREKRCTPVGLKAYGAIAEDGSCVIPMYGPDGKTCSEFAMAPGAKGEYAKGRYAKGKHVGLFLPGKRPQPGETWLIVEGAKDASALHDLGFNAAGLPGSAMAAKFAPLFSGVNAVIVPDADKPGHAGAAKTAKVLQGVAASVKIALLPCEISESGGADVRDILHDRLDGAEQIRRCIEGAGPATADPLGNDAPERFEQLTCAGLVSREFPIQYLVEDMLVKGQPCIIAGPKKGLKTSLTVDLCLSLATGGHFLGKFLVPEAVPVGLLTGESGLATIQETVLRISRKTGRNPALVDRFLIVDTVPRFGDAASEAAFAHFVADNKLAAVIVDPVYMAFPGGDAGNLFVQGEYLRAASQICQATDCTLVLVHHTRKNLAEPYGQPELEDIAWAGFQEFARQWLLVNRRAKYTPGTGSHKLWLSIGGSVGHGSLWGLDIEEGVTPNRVWDVSVMPPEEVREGVARQRAERRTEKDQEKLDGSKERIVKIAAKFKGGETSTALRDGAGLRDPDFKPALAALIESGDLIPWGILKSNRKTPYPGYILSSYVNTTQE